MLSILRDPVRREGVARMRQREGSHTMSKFLYLYRGPARPMENFTPEESAEQMKAWGEWMGRVGSSLVDGGAPFGARSAVSDDGGTVAASEQNGYTIVEAADLDGAVKLLDGHPFLSEGKGRFAIDVYELVPMSM
jgi:hypothetical protein